MVDRHHQTEAMRRDIATSTDPQWHRDRFGIPQHSAFQIIGIAILGLAFMAAIVAIGSI